ncbi:MAG: sensor domain-containing diguanylate cyclase [Erysipelotrichaceae bacterium]
MDLDNIQYKIIVEASPNMIWRSGKDALCDYFNVTWMKFTGKTMEEEVGTGWAEGVHPDDYVTCIRIYMDAFAKQEAFEMEYRLKRYDGVYRWINDRGTPFYLDNHEFAGYIGSCIDVTDRVEGQKMQMLAQKDGLTSVFSRQYFEQIGNIEFLRAKRFNLDLTLVMIDVDEFKYINDAFGHIAGDYVLKEVAKTMLTHIRNFDLLARFGGDEFVLLMFNTSQAEADIFVERLEKEIGTLNIKFEDHVLKISVSFGIYQLNKEDKFEQVIAEADKRLYEKKRNKKDL